MILVVQMGMLFEYEQERKTFKKKKKKKEQERETKDCKMRTVECNVAPKRAQLVQHG